MTKDIQIEIIPAVYSYVPQILEIWKEFIDYHRDIDPFFTRRADGHSNFAKLVENLIDSDESRVLVATSGNEVIGYCIGMISEYPPVYTRMKYGLISDVAVRSRYRRRGIGEMLVAEILDWFESCGIDRIELHVVAKNEIGYSFWRKHGFKDYFHILYRNMSPSPDAVRPKDERET